MEVFPEATFVQKPSSIELTHFLVIFGKTFRFVRL